MQRFIRYYFKLAKLRLMQAMAYRTNFIMAVLGSYGFTFLNLIFLYTIFDNFESIGGWSKYQVIFMFGYYQFVYYFYAIFFGAIEKLDVYIKDGVIDAYLVRPVNAFWSLITSHSNLILVPPNLLIAFFIAYLGLANTNFEVNRLVYIVLLFPFGVGAFTGSRLVISLMSFWLNDTNAFVRLFNQTEENLSKFPIDVLPTVFQKILFVFVPVAIAGYVPVKMFYFGLDLKLLVSYIVVVILFCLLAGSMWKKGLLSYSSASS